MKYFCLFLRATSILVLAALLGQAGVLGASSPAGGEIKPKKETDAERIRRVLELPISVDLTQHSLTEVIRLLHDQTHLNYVLDRLTIQQLGINPEEAPVTTRLKMKAGNGLRQALGHYNLSYVIIGDMVLITSEEMAIQRQMRQRVSVKFENLQLNAALRQLARETATNLVIDGRVAKKALTPVTLTLNDAPLETVVQLLANMTGLKPVRVGNVLYVTTKANAAELRADPDSVPPGIPNGGRGIFIDDVEVGGVHRHHPGIPGQPRAATCRRPGRSCPRRQQGREKGRQEGRKTRGEEKRRLIV
jgi:hypothetical protein